ncbi:hypothetical protein VO63_30135 [Streptomyces showdoensis]|uniref:PBS lyase n=1 Tax=Streptomyces showdoensis TaxID=68268 RepID=A0A2P2GFD7_STREW|nr:hypothetical protein VO63_30135 [Streptomyces showdoensis]
MARVLDVTSATAWTDLDEQIRRAVGWGAVERPEHPWLGPVGTGGSSGWRALLGRTATATTPDETRLALALCDPSGVIREAALAHAAGRPAVLPLVAVRATDWAAPVRDRARAVLADALPSADAATLAATAPVLLRIRGRLRGAEGAALLEERLRTAPAEVLTPLFLHRDRATRRLALRVAMERALFEPRELARIAAADPDQAVRSSAATAAVAADAPDETLGPLLGARTGPVRAAGVTALRRAGRHAEAEPFLHDRSGTVRACARWVLRQGGADPVALYRAACADPQTMPDRAPLGLAECGERAVDLPVLWALTGHPRPLARSSAVAGLRALDVADLTRLLPLLDDPAPGVVRETAKALAPWADRLPERELLDRTGPGRPPHVRIRALRLLRDNGSWTYAETARRLAEDPDPVLRYQVRRSLGLRT